MDNHGLSCLVFATEIVGANIQFLSSTSGPDQHRVTFFIEYVRNCSIAPF